MDEVIEILKKKAKDQGLEVQVETLYDSDGVCGCLSCRMKNYYVRPDHIKGFEDLQDKAGTAKHTQIMMENLRTLANTDSASNQKIYDEAVKFEFPEMIESALLFSELKTRSENLLTRIHAAERAYVDKEEKKAREEVRSYMKEKPPTEDLQEQKAPPADATDVGF